MQIISFIPYNVNGGKRPKHTHYFYLFSGASNLRSLQNTYLKFAEYVDILAQIIYAKLNDRAIDYGYTRCMKFFFREVFQQSVFHCCYSNVQIAINYCQGYSSVGF